MIAARALAIVLLLTAVSAGCNAVVRAFMSPDDPPEGQRGLSLSELPPGALEVVARGLEVPWEIAFLPDGGLLVTERPGRLSRLPPFESGQVPYGPEDAETWTIEGVSAGGEGGLMGLALHPVFGSGSSGGGARTSPAEADEWIYLMFTADGPEGIRNRVVRYRLTPQGPVDPFRIVEGIPGNRFHDGGRIEFGPDGGLYVTTGDAGEPSTAQESGSLAGKILRLDDSGGVPPTNPDGTVVWSMGHRNPQGLAWDRDGRLWSTEHGRSGFQTGMDELNLIEAGANYGWPLIEGDERSGQMRPPVIHSGGDYTWAPGDVASVGDRLFFGGLRGGALYEGVVVNGEVSDLRAHFASELGRIRAVRLGPDGLLYVTTSNRDGRGAVGDGDDRILRIDPTVFDR